MYIEREYSRSSSYKLAKSQHNSYPILHAYRFYCTSLPKNSSSFSPLPAFVVSSIHTYSHLYYRFSYCPCFRLCPPLSLNIVFTCCFHPHLITNFQCPSSIAPSIFSTPTAFTLQVLHYFYYKYLGISTIFPLNRKI